MNTDINKEIEEMLKQFLEQFGADKIWVTPSRDNVETILEIWRFFGQSLHTIAEKAREEERERIEEKIKGMTVNGNAMVGLANDLLQAFKSEALSTPQSNEK